MEDKRRDFLFYASAGTGASIASAAMLPRLHTTGHANQQVATGMQVSVDGVAPGTQISVTFQGMPIFIRRRTKAEIAEARRTDLDELPDTHGRNANLPEADASDENRTIAPFEGQDLGEWLVIEGVCPHLGCVPLGDGAGDFNGWFCPCHGAHFDASGRTRAGPAQTNLPVPRAAFLDGAILHLIDRGRFGILN